MLYCLSTSEHKGDDEDGFDSFVLQRAGEGGSPAGSVRESYHFRAEIPKAARVGISVKATLVHRACWSLKAAEFIFCNLSGTAGICPVSSETELFCFILYTKIFRIK